MPTQYQCPKCKSDDVVVDASARWNVETQKFELSCTYDNMSCCECDYESDDHSKFEVAVQS